MKIFSLKNTNFMAKKHFYEILFIMNLYIYIIKLKSNIKKLLILLYIKKLFYYYYCLINGSTNKSTN